MKINENEKEFVRKLRTNQAILHKICYLYAVNQAEREDLYQEMTLQLWKAFPSFKGKSKFSTWMYRVSLNTAITFVKKRTRVNIDFLEDSDMIADRIDIEKSEVKSEEIRILRRAIAKLDKIEKAVILLWLEEKKYQEIAEIVGVNVKNVSVKLVRIKRKLAKLMKETQ